MADSTPDFYHQKTDIELQFFVENPDHHQPDIVAEARRELRRRGVALPEPLFEPSDLSVVDVMPTAGRKIGPLTLLAIGLVAGCAGTLYVVRSHDAASAQAAAIAALRPPPRLTEVATSLIPDFSEAVRTSVLRQVQNIPAAERQAAAKAAMPLRQYRELAKRFWTAETQTEYVLNQARQGRLNAALPGHVQTAEAGWEQWNKALGYGYRFSPVMARHLDMMTRVARQQQEGLADLLIVANNPQAYENDKTRQRDADVNDLLAGLLPNSPVTGQPYSTIVRRVQL